MTYQEARDQAAQINKNGKLTAKIVRVLPREIDPIRKGDNGWDVEVTIAPTTVMPDEFFRELTPAQTEEFKQWARDNYEPGSPISAIWHPVVRAECARINEEAGKVFSK